MKILIIEDDEMFQNLALSVLARQGYEVAVAADGATGLQMALENAYDAIVLDLMMPRLHGYEVIQRLRETAATQRLPILVISAKIYESDQRKALELGASRFLQKPFDPVAMGDAVRHLLECVRVTFWGTRGSIAAAGQETVRYGGNTPCVSLSYRGRTLILDAGTGIRKLGLILQAEARGRPYDVDLLITHTHWDHIQGFPFFVPAYVPGNRVNVYGPRSASKPLDKVLRGQMDPEYFPVALGDMAATVRVNDLRDAPLDIGPYHVTYSYLNHPGVTLGYRIEVGGLAIAYATDTEPFGRLLRHTMPDGSAADTYGPRLDQNLVDLARCADLYIGDAQYAPDEYSGKVGWGHSSCSDAVEVGLRAEAKRLVLFSHDPMHSDEAVDALLAICRELASERGPGRLEVDAAREGHTIALPVARPND